MHTRTNLIGLVALLAAACGNHAGGNGDGGGEVCGNSTCDPRESCTDCPADCGVCSTDIAEIAVGGEHTCARRGDGSVSCWGDNTSGELGYATTHMCPVPSRNGAMVPCNSTPQQVTALGGIVGLANTDYRSYAWNADGTAWRWGTNELDTLASAQPTAVPDLSDFAQLAPGVAFSCARLADGTVACSGANNNGQLGDATTTPHSWSLVPGLSGVVAVAAGQAHACALLGDKTVACWGANPARQLGFATTVSCDLPDQFPCSKMPTTVPGLTGVVEITAGEYHTCARLGDGTVQCWGDNIDGELGVVTAETCSWGGGTTPCSTAPTPVTGLTNVTQIVAGWWDTCALLADRSVMCWGLNQDGQLGHPSTDTCLASSPCSLAPAAVQALSNVAEISISRSRHTCARRVDGEVLCWGLNNAGQVGDGTTNDATTPTPVAW